MEFVTPDIAIDPYSIAASVIIFPCHPICSHAYRIAVDRVELACSSSASRCSTIFQSQVIR